MADTTVFDSNAKSGSSPGSSPGVRLGRVRWTVCAMLFVATSINYMDRQVIAILKPTLEHSIGMTEVGYGYIVDAFQIAYAIGLLAAGRLIDKLGTRIGYMLVMAVWSLSAMGHALANTVLEFGFARFFLGLGESGNFPAAIKTVAEWFPQNERSLATGIFNSGANVGAVLAPAIVPWVTLRYGWHAAFLTTGLFSLLWILWWFRNYRRPADHPMLTAGELRHIYQEAAVEMGPSPFVPWRRLLSFRQTWAFSVAKFLTDPIWYFYLFWLPSYFSAKFNLNLSHLGLPLIIIYNVSAIGSIGGGWLPSPFRRLGLSSNYARLAAMLFCACLVVPIYTASSVKSMWTAIALISLAAGAHQGWSANLFTTSSDMFPRGAVGSVVGIGGMAGSAGSALFAFFAGHILQLTHSYTSLFGIAASAYLLALVVLWLLAPGLKKVELAA
ncbi:MAG TPA: MFS transporter [Terriglobales bacterium]|jgi:ACS family hexuronate transporter-like MFS transporter|nr:MFS transporter [Terriglobales bacterium]